MDPFNYVDPFGEKYYDIKTGRWVLQEPEIQKIKQLQTFIANLQALRQQVEKKYAEALEPTIQSFEYRTPPWVLRDRCIAQTRLDKIDKAIAAVQAYVAAIEGWEPSTGFFWVTPKHLPNWTRPTGGVPFPFADYEGRTPEWEKILRAFAAGAIAGAEVGLINSPSFFNDKIASQLVRRVGTTRKKIREVSLERLEPLHRVPRPDVPKDHINNLALSIVKKGFDINQAIPVIRMPDGRLFIGGGHHRVAAMKKLHQPTIPARIVDWRTMHPRAQARYREHFPHIFTNY